jgi:hypothetical protein
MPMIPQRFDVWAMDPFFPGDGHYLCTRYTAEAAKQAIDEFAPRWPGKQLTVVPIPPLPLSPKKDITDGTD